MASSLQLSVKKYFISTHLKSVPERTGQIIFYLWTSLPAFLFVLQFSSNTPRKMTTKRCKRSLKRCKPTTKRQNNHRDRKKTQMWFVLSHPSSVGAAGFLTEGKSCVCMNTEGGFTCCNSSSCLLLNVCVSVDSCYLRNKNKSNFMLKKKKGCNCARRPLNVSVFIHQLQRKHLLDGFLN